MRQRRQRRLAPGRVRLDVEKWEVLGMARMQHWCSKCKRVHEFELHEATYTWYNECGGSVLLQQLIIEGLLSEAKYHGIENQ